MIHTFFYDSAGLTGRGPHHGREDPVKATATGEPERKRLPRLQHVAYHEAGHAVADYVQHRRFTEISIIPQKVQSGCRVQTCAGYVTTTGQPPFPPDADMKPGGRTRRWIEREAICFFAGPIAEGIASGHQPERSAHSYDTCRPLDLVRLFLTRDLEEADAYLNWLWIRAQRLVRSHWSEIETLAAELLKHRRIGGRQAREMVRRAQERAGDAA